MKKNTYTLIVLSIAFFCVLAYVTSFYMIKTPVYRSVYDTFAHIGTLKFLESNIYPSNYDSNFFPRLFVNDFHCGLNVFFEAIIKPILGINDIQLYFVIGVIHILLLVFALAYFLKCLEIDDESKIIVLLLFFLGTTGIPKHFASSLSISDLLVMAHYPAIFGFSVLLILLSININREKNDFIFFTINAILFLILFGTHILSAFMFLISFSLLIFYLSVISNKVRFDKISILIVYFLIMLILIKWPYYNWLTFFVKSKAIQNTNTILPFSLQDFLQYFSILFIGVFGINKTDKKMFLYFWLVFFLIINISFLLPFRISSYWRFIIFLKIPLTIGMVYLILKIFSNVNTKFFVLNLLFLIFVISNVNNFTQSISSKKSDYLLSKNIQQVLPEYTKILTNPELSYMLQALGNYQVYLIPTKHVGDLETQILNAKRIADWETECNMLNNKSIFFDYIILNTTNENELRLKSTIVKKDYIFVQKIDCYEIYRKS